MKKLLTKRPKKIIFEDLEYNFELDGVKGTVVFGAWAYLYNGICEVILRDVTMAYADKECDSAYIISVLEETLKDIVKQGVEK